MSEEFEKIDGTWVCSEDSRFTKVDGGITYVGEPVCTFMVREEGFTMNGVPLPVNKTIVMNPGDQLKGPSLTTPVNYTGEIELADLQGITSKDLKWKFQGNE